MSVSLLLILILPSQAGDAPAIPPQTAPTNSTRDGATDDGLQVEKQRVEETLRLARGEGRSYEISLLTDPKVKLELDETSILRWTNPITGAYGELFVWTKCNRPLVIASIYQYYSPQRYLAVEFQSLASGKLIAIRGGEEVWYPSTSGVEFKPLQTVPRPASSKAQRLVQMRKLARDFQIQFTTPEGDKEWLRLMPHPNYQYQCPSENVLDGAVFIFAQGTNPEAVLLLEARQSEDDVQWFFSLGRQTGYQMAASREKEIVWTVPTALGDLKLRRTEPYTAFYRYLTPQNLQSTPTVP